MGFEININFFEKFKQNISLPIEDFTRCEKIFNVFDGNGDGNKCLNYSEIISIFQQLHLYENTGDTRPDADNILDSTEAEQFLNNGKNQHGESYKTLGIDIDQLLNFLNILKSKAEQSAVIYSKDSFSNDSLTKEVESNETENIELKNRAQTLDLPERFNDNDKITLASLSDEQLEDAKKLFFVENRQTQFSADEIYNLITACGGKYKINEENNDRFSEFLTLQNADNEYLSDTDIVLLMTLPKEKIDTAITLLHLENRKDDPLSMRDIVAILACESEELITSLVQNPNLKYQDKIKTSSQYWVSLIDQESNLTYRYIKGQKYPEKICDEILEDGNILRTVDNQNLNIKQKIILNKDNPKDSASLIRIETQHLTPDGNIEYTEIMEKGNNPGTPDVYTVDSNGKKVFLQQTIIDGNDGTKRVYKNFTDSQGNSTEFEYVSLPDQGYKLKYNIESNASDKNGKTILFNKEAKLAKIEDNVYEYEYNGNIYQITIEFDKCTIQDKSNNTEHVFKYSDYIKEEDNPQMFIQNILNIPADTLVFLSNRTLSLSYGTKTRDNQGICKVDEPAIDIGTITKTNSESELNEAFITILIHELGHYIDNPDLSDENCDILSMDNEFKKIYEEELREFNNTHSTEEQNIIRQFNGIGFAGKTQETQEKRARSEVFAESNMISNTNSKEWTSARSYYLQRYFPKTIAKAQELLSQRIH